ncbi:MAG: rhodanese-like domain-containing protein, partial [Woeseiaceae bacterium]
ECTVSEAKKVLTPSTLLIDIREPEEFRRGHLPGSVLSPRGLLEFEIHPLVQRTATDPDVAAEDRQIVLYCGTGGRSALAAETLTNMGYRNVTSMDGGIVAWTAAGLPVDSPT